MNSLDFENNPINFVFPIIIVRKGEPKFIGTCFYFENNLVTARHVLEDHLPYEEGDYFQIVFLNINTGEPTISNFKLTSPLPDSHIDCIFISFPTFSKSKGQLDLLPKQISNSFEDVICYEHSPTLISDRNKEIPSLHVNPYHYKGNILRSKHKNTSLFYEVSFPALAGASGAPVLLRKTKQVIGIITGNNDAELSPISRYEHANGEETTYMLPHGIALSSDTIIKKKGDIIVKAKYI